MFRVFSQKWFEYYQKALLLYANTLGRDRLQIETNKRIVGIQPHSVTWQEDKHGLKSTAFYPRSPFADGLRMDLWPFWKTLHALDMSFLARRLSLNFGFDTLTKYPDAHTETDTVDGVVTRNNVNQTFANIRAGDGIEAYDALATSLIVALKSTETTDQYEQLQRGIILFSTSALTSGAVIAAATYGFRTTTDVSILLGDTNFCLVSSDPASNTVLAKSDYQRTWGTTDLFETPFAISTISTDTRVTKNISSAGIALISKTGLTKFGHKLGWDLTGDTTGLVWASGVKRTNVPIYLADYGTPATYAPQLIVTYILPTVVSPAPVAVTFSLQAPAVTGKALVSPAPLSLLLGGVTPAVSDEELVLPNALALVLTPQAPTISGKASIAPNPIALALTVQAPTVYAGTTYYVDATLGDNAHDGKSTAEPWKTIAKVNGVVFVPNDQILFKRGETWAEMLRPICSGAAGAPILFGSYGSGALPIINGGAFNISPVTRSYLTFQELDCRNPITYHGIYISGSDHIIVKDCVVTGPSPGYDGIKIDGGSYNTVQNCTVYEINDAVGIRIYNSDYAHVHGNILYDITGAGIYTPGSSYSEIDYNDCAYCGGAGIYIGSTNHKVHHNHSHHSIPLTPRTWTEESANLWYCTAAVNPWIVTFSLVAGNKQTTKGAVDSVNDWWWDDPNDRCYVYSTTDPTATVEVGTIGDGESYGLGISNGSHCEIYDNEFNDNGQVGVEFWSGLAGSCHSNKFYRNKVYNNLYHGMSFTGWGDANPFYCDNEVYYNLIYDNGWAGIMLSSDDGVGTGNKIYNNIIVGNVGAYPGLPIGGIAIGELTDGVDPVTSWTIRNNILANNTVRELEIKAETVIVHDHNLYYRASGDTVLDVAIGYDCSEVVAGFEATAVVTDPLFIDEVAHDYHLQGGSLAIGAGVDVGLTTDYDLVSVPDPPTMGAYEYIGDMTVYPAAMAMALAAQSPTITGKGLISPSALSLLLGIQAPTVEVKILISPAALALALATQSPTIGSGIIISPAALAFVLALQAPIVSDYEVVSPVALNLALGVQVPTIGSGIIISPAALALALGVQIPAITGKGLISPAALAIALGVQTPAIAGKAEISPAAISLTLGIQTPTIAGLAIVTPAALSLALSMGAPTISGLALISPTALSLILGIEAPSVGVSTIVSPAALTLALGMESPAITGLALVSPGALAVTLAIQSPVITGLAVISPDAIPLVLGLQVPTIGGAALISPASLGITLGVQAETVTGAGIISPAALALSLGVPVVAVSGAALVSPAALSMALNAVVPTVEGKALISPAAINLLLGIQPATASGAALVSPGPVALTLGIPGVTVTGKALISPASIALAFAMGVPIIMIGVSGIIDFIAYVDCNILTDAKVDRNLAADAEVKH